MAANRQNLRTAEPIMRFKSEYERAKHREGMSRRYHIRMFNDTFSPTSFHTVLTLDNDNECHTFHDARKLGNLYVRNLKYAFPDAKIMLYMGRGRKTNRIHFHMVSEGVDGLTIDEKWKYGEIVLQENLREHNYYDRVDHGQDYTGLANYLFDHWTPEHGTRRRWRATKNIKAPEPERETIVNTNYSERNPPRAPKGYRLVECRSNKFGYQCFKYIKDVEPRSQRMRN